MGALRRPFPRRGGRTPPAKRAPLAVEALESRVTPYTVSGNSWVFPERVTISFVPDGTDLGGVSSNLFATLNARYAQGYWQNQVLKAVQVWAKQTNLNFDVVWDNGSPIGNGTYQQGSPSFGDIRIGGFNFGSSALAGAFLPPQANNFSIAGDFQFNTGQSWVIGTTGGYDIFTVAMHEFGHALGLLHSASYYSVLYPNYVGARTGLGADDVNGVRSIYDGVRARDAFDEAASNGSTSTATLLDGLIDPGSLTALLTGLDITTYSDLDFFRFSVPSGTSGTMTVTLRSRDLSLLAPTLSLYSASELVLQHVSGAGQYGTTLTITLTGVQPGQTYFVRVGGAEANVFGTGRYALTLNFGDGPPPSVPLPYSLTPNGNPLQAGGVQPEEPGHEDGGHLVPPPRASAPAAVRADRIVVATLQDSSRPLPATAGAGGTSVRGPMPAAFSNGNGEAKSVILLPGLRLESNAVLPAETTSFERIQVEPSAAVPDAEAIPTPQSAPEEPAAALEQAACDRCFQGPDGMAEAVDIDDEALALEGAFLGAAVDPLAAAAVLAVVLGGWWAAPPDDPDPSKVRPIRV